MVLTYSFERLVNKLLTKLVIQPKIYVLILLLPLESTFFLQTVRKGEVVDEKHR